MTNQINSIKKVFDWFLCLIVLNILPIKFALAQSNDGYGLETAAQSAGLKRDIDLPTMAGQIVGSVLGLVGVIFLVLMIYSGITWMTAAGNENSIKKAKQILTASIGGLINILSAYAITSFLGGALGT